MLLLVRRRLVHIHNDVLGVRVTCHVRERLCVATGQRHTRPAPVAIEQTATDLARVNWVDVSCCSRCHGC